MQVNKSISLLGPTAKGYCYYYFPFFNKDMGPPLEGISWNGL